MRSSVSRGLNNELSNLVKGVKRSSDIAKNGFAPSMGARTGNVKRHSRRSSMLNRGLKVRAAAWENKEMVVYRSTKCLGQMLNLVLKQVGNLGLFKQRFGFLFLFNHLPFFLNLSLINEALL